MKKLALILTTLAFGAVASAKSMTCLINVYKVQDLIGDQEDMEKTTLLATVELQTAANGTVTGNKRFLINGETVDLVFRKRTHADVYDLNVALLPSANASNNDAAYMMGMKEVLINAGPSKENPGATIFEYTMHSRGTMQLTAPVRKLLIANDKWANPKEVNGKYMFLSSGLLSTGFGSSVIDAIQELHDEGKIEKSQTVMVAADQQCELSN
jgi:hypothetical protein